MTNEEKDKKVLSSLLEESEKLSSLLSEYSLDTIKKNHILERAVSFDILRLSRLYKKLGGRYAKRFNEYNDKLREWGNEIEKDPSSFHHDSLISEVHDDLPILIDRIKKISASI